jgi:hypothetical protein
MAHVETYLHTILNTDHTKTDTFYVKIFCFTRFMVHI